MTCYQPNDEGNPMSEPVDPTTTPAWARLTALYESLQPDLRGWFAADPSRAKSFTFQAGDLYVDLSKNLINSEILSALVDLADQVGLADRRDAMLAGEHINVTEDRAVLHTALRAPEGSSLVVDGVDVIPEVHEVLAKVYAFADKVRSGEWVGVTGKPIATVVNIGIGGSDLGPVMVYEALQPYVKPGLKARFISNIDPTDVAEKTKDLDPETTLFIVASKTFTTLETLTNARLSRSWLLDGLRASGAIEEGDEAANAAVAKHFVAVSTALDKVAAFGIDPDNAFGFWDWVGGRYSVDSAIGTSVAVTIGPENFADFLAGFHAIDRHFAETEFSNNVPVLMGLLNVWYVNFFKAASHVVLAVRAIPAPIPGVPAAAHHGVQWQGRPVRRLAGHHRYRRGVLGRAGHQRPARLLPADPSGHPGDPGRLHRGGQSGQPAGRWRQRRTRVVPGQLLRPDCGIGVWQDRRTRYAPRALQMRSFRRGSSPETARPHRSWPPS